MRPLPAGEGVNGLELTWRRTEETARAQSQMFEALSTGLLVVEACYCDIYERCWVTQTSTFPRPVSECPAPTGFPIGLVFGQEDAPE